MIQLFEIEDDDICDLFKDDLYFIWETLLNSDI